MAEVAVGRRTVAGRLVALYLVVLVAFAITVGSSFLALRGAAQDATVVRDVLIPLRAMIGDALADQNVMNTQLNHIISAKNPEDVKQWITTARRVHSYRKLAERARSTFRPALDRHGLGAYVISETEALQRELAAGDDLFDQLFGALDAGDMARAELMRDKLAAIQTSGARRLRSLRDRFDQDMSLLTDAAEQRRRRSIFFLIGLSALTLMITLATSLYARRVLSPLTKVTARARAVAAGDLAPQAVVGTDDEIGELAETFEGMVGAIVQARSKLVQAERLATIGKVAAHVTHEVRNPLSSIGLNLELLEDEHLSVESRQLLEAIKAEVERLSQITNQYLSVVREPQLALHEESLGDLVSECHAFLKPELERAGIRSRVELEADVPLVRIDEAQFRQALVNLLRNAREALPKGGEVVLRVSSEEPSRAVICIDDDGLGIAEDVRSSIFDPFYTTKRHGTGLGLAVTRSIVEAHDGTIVCQTSPGGGTSFRISLPALNP